MAITRKYETKEECVGLFMDEQFEYFPSWTVTEQPDFFETWEFMGIQDAEDDWLDGYEEDSFGYTHEPMWTNWFIPSDWVRRFVKSNEERVAEMGFTLIYNEGVLFALGIDGAGYSFRDAQFTELYDAMGIRWHE